MHLYIINHEKRITLCVCKFFFFKKYVICVCGSHKMVIGLASFSEETYAAYRNETESNRLDSHDFTYSNGKYTYHDTYAGGEQFVGEEAIWYEGKSQYAMNYVGRVLSQRFSGDFLKEALRKADMNMPYRGPEYYQSGQYTYKCNVAGDFTWFQGQN